MDIETVHKVARLARLDLTEAEAEQLVTQLARVLQYVERLGDVDTEGVEPLVHAIDQSNSFRADDVSESLLREAAIRNAPATDGGYFLVPDILDKQDS